MTITPYVPPAALSGLPSGIWSGAQGLPVFPYLPGQMPTVTKAPLFSTKVNRAVSGRERRTPRWTYPLWQFKLQYEVIRHKPTVPELFILYEFFNAQQGMYAPWLFVDPTDNAAAAGSSTMNTVTGLATADGSTKTFQMMRAINSVIEPVYDVYSASVTVLDNGGAAGAHTFTPNGVISFSSAPTAGHTITWSGNFYFGCRFLSDSMALDQIVQLLWQGKGVEFTSIMA